MKTTRSRRSSKTKPAKPILELAKRIRFDFVEGPTIRSDKGAGSANDVSSLPSKSQTCTRSSNVKWHSGQRFMARIANSIGETGAGKRCRFGLVEWNRRQREYTHHPKRTTITPDSRNLQRRF